MHKAAFMSFSNVKDDFLLVRSDETFSGHIRSRIDLPLVRIVPHRRCYRKSSMRKILCATCENRALLNMCLTYPSLLIN